MCAGDSGDAVLSLRVRCAINRRGQAAASAESSALTASRATMDSVGVPRMPPGSRAPHAGV
jgi:hypothetical protein